MKLKEKSKVIGLTDEETEEVVRVFGERFHLTELEMEIGDISITVKKDESGRSTQVLCHGKPIQGVTSCYIAITPLSVPRIFLGIY